jgi:hypothetical protein
MTNRGLPRVWRCYCGATTARCVGADSGKVEITEMGVGKVKTGMIILDDVRTPLGVLLVPKGFEVTDAFIERMRNFGSGILSERIRVSGPSVPAPRNAKPQA